MTTLIGIAVLILVIQVLGFFRPKEQDWTFELTPKTMNYLEALEREAEQVKPSNPQPWPWQHSYGGNYFELLWDVRRPFTGEVNRG